MDISGRSLDAVEKAVRTTGGVFKNMGVWAARAEEALTRASEEKSGVEGGKRARLRKKSVERKLAEMKTG
ncbi:MAG: hypothetical protein ACRYGG_09610 [Janthinobacterium lividum]